MLSKKKEIIKQSEQEAESAMKQRKEKTKKRAEKILNCITDAQKSEEEKIQYLTKKFKVTKKSNFAIKDNPFLDQAPSAHVMLCEELEKLNAMHKALIDDNIPISVMQFLINNDVAIDTEDKERHTPFTKCLQQTKRSSLQDLKLFLYVYNAMLIYTMEPSKEKINKKTDQYRLTNAKEILEWGFDDTDKNKEIITYFFKGIIKNKSKKLASKEFKNSLLQEQIKKAKDHNAFDSELVQAKIEFFRKEGISDEEVEKWQEDLEITRGKFSLNQFLASDLEIEQERSSSPFKRKNEERDVQTDKQDAESCSKKRKHEESISEVDNQCIEPCKKSRFKGVKVQAEDLNKKINYSTNKEKPSSAIVVRAILNQKNKLNSKDKECNPDLS